jgi:succinyl-CoA synthetase beta subunit
MNFEEHIAKDLLLAGGIDTPQGALVASAKAAAEIAARLGPSVVKAQVPTGKRGKAGGIRLAATPDEAAAAAQAILGMSIGEHRVAKVLIEEQIAIARELYIAILNDPPSKGPLLLFSTRGGMDIEAIASYHPNALVRVPIDIRSGPDAAVLQRELLGEAGMDRGALVDLIRRLYSVYAAHDAELVEINPLALTTDRRLIALDCKLVIDDSAAPRQEKLTAQATPEQLTPIETRAAALGLKFIELDGNVGVLANGAGLTMTTMDAIRHYGGRPANFMEIGGESYTKAKPALELVLANARVRCLLVNFCGAFARTDTMVEGVCSAWRELKLSLPIFFTIHGTGEDEAIAMVRERLGLEPFDLMDDAVKAAVAAAAGGQA